MSNTDSQVGSLNTQIQLTGTQSTALIPAKKVAQASSASIASPSSTAILTPYLITPVVVVTNAGATILGWTTFDASSYVPGTAKALILEYECSMSSPDVGSPPLDAYIYMRPTGLTSQYVLARGRAAGTGDNVAWGGQGMIIPGSNGTSNFCFDYEVPTPSFDNGYTIRLVGYWG